MRVLLPISFLSQFKPQNSDNVPKTVAAKILLVPNPLPAGIAESKVSSIPHPKASRCWRSVGYSSVPKPGRKPHSVNAALGMEKGEPTLLYCRSSS